MKNKKPIVQTIALLLLLILLITYLNFLLLPKNTHDEFDMHYDYSYAMWKEFYKFGKDELDIVNLGSSHCNCSLIPAQINQRFKVDSYNLATMGANMDDIYFQLKEVLKYQSPKIITVELFSLFELTSKDTFHQRALHGMRLSSNKVDAARTLLPNKPLDAVFPLAVNHANWRYLEFPKDFIRAFKHDTSITQYGYLPFTKVYDNEQGYALPLDRNVEITDVSLSEKQKVKLQRISNLCKAHDVELVFVIAPFFEQMGVDYTKMLELTSSIRVFCSENDIGYFNSFEQLDSLDIEIYDFLDAGHLNVSGATKVTSSFSAYIASNYNSLLTECNWDYQTQSTEKYNKLFETTQP